MTSKNSVQMGGTRALLLGVMVVVATVAVISTFSREEPVDESTTAPEAVDEAVVEVTPLLPTGAIKAASWHDGSDPRQAAVDAEAEAEAEASAPSLLDDVGFGEHDKRRRYEKSVEKTVSGIEGLGVYVAPQEDADKPDKKKKR
jgi:hypothetical protein